MAKTAQVAPGAVLGLDVVVGDFCLVAPGAHVGRGTRVQSHTSVWAGVTLGEDVFIGPSVTFTNVRTPRAHVSRAPRGLHETWDETRVDHGASLGAACTLVAPLRVGAHALVGAGAVVTRDVPPHAVVIGVPARVTAWACTCGAIVARGSRPPPRATCASCGRALERDGVGLREAAR